MRSFSGVRASSYLALALAALVLLRVFSSGRLTPTTENAHMSRSDDRGVPPHKYRAHEVDGDSGLMKFVLQEQADSHGTAAAEASWRTLSFEEVALLWRNSRDFAEMFMDSVKAVPFEAVFWESAPVTRTTMDKPYEYVMVDSPTLAKVSADGSPFAEYIDGATTDDVVSFRNLRKDACLVVPRQGEEQQPQRHQPEAGANYAHLAAFVRTAPREQVIDFFGAVGEALDNEVATRSNDRPVWLSTSGLGVYWLHVRLDSTPKYYTYSPYKAMRKVSSLTP